jgi:hypothetical protein
LGRVIIRKLESDPERIDAAFRAARIERVAAVFTIPLSESLQPMPLLIDDFDRSMRLLQEAGERDGVAVRLMRVLSLWMCLHSPERTLDMSKTPDRIFISIAVSRPRVINDGSGMTLIACRALDSTLPSTSVSAGHSAPLASIF